MSAAMPFRCVASATVPIVAAVVLGAARAEAQIDYNKDVRPILQANCFKCHGPNQAKSGLRLHTRAAALKGGGEGPAIAPGNAGGSLLIQMVVDEDMPPFGEGDPLSAGEIAVLRQWINQGAQYGPAAAPKPKPPAAAEKPERPAVPGRPAETPFPPREAAPEVPAPAPPAEPVPELPDLSALPSHDGEVDFARDVRPLLEEHCLKCHGPERPKSGFRLDNREAALRGGSQGVAILPGNGDGSPLVHFVARAVDGMEMPPAGQGEPLTGQEVALLRAWIDQGAKWDGPAETPDFAFSITPMARWFWVDGNEQKFREHAWMPDGWSGGVARFTAQGWIDLDTRFTAEGRIDAPGNHDLEFELDRQGIGFVRAGAEQLRRYYNDYGGYYEPFESFQQPAFRLGRDFELDVGRVWTEVGLRLPRWPEITLGYEYRYREGVKPTLHWGPSMQGGETRNIYPAFKRIDESVHLLRADARYDWDGLLLENNFLAEFRDLDTRRLEVSPGSFGATPDTFTAIEEWYESTHLTNTFSVQKEITDWWLLSGGYLFSHLDADAAFRQSTMNAASEPVVGQHWFSQPIVLDWHTHVFNVSTRLGPWKGATLSAGFQNQWEQQDGLGNSTLFFGLPDPMVPIPGFFSSTVTSSKQSVITTGHAALRYDRIPRTVLFAEAEWEHEHTDYSEQDPGLLLTFLRDTESSSLDQDYRTGVTWRPLPRVTLHSHYGYRHKKNDYDHQRDESAGGAPNPGYSAFIVGRDIETHEFQTRLNVRPAPWLQTMLTYRVQATDYETDTEGVPLGLPADPPGGSLLAGEYDSSVYGVNVVLTPWQRLAMNGALTWHDSRTRTASNGDPAVVEYEGDHYSIVAGGTYTIDDKTAFSAHYSFSSGDYSQDNAAGGLPLGIEYYQHGVQAALSTRISDNLRAQLQYQFQQYDEPSSGGVNDYTAHGIFLNCTLDWK